MLFIFFLLLPTVTHCLSTHLSDSLRLKCDSLLYRSRYGDDRCYFAVLEQVEESDKSARCSSILKGAKAVIDVPATIFNEMMVDKSKFHMGSETQARHVMCTHATGYTCEAPETQLVSGLCLHRAPKSMNFTQANSYCRDQGMEIPAPDNDFENQIIRGALVKAPAWVQKSSVRANKNNWSQATHFNRWTTCDGRSQKPPTYPGSQNMLWRIRGDGGYNDIASVLDRNGYWSNGGIENLMDVVCVKPAVNEFTRAAKIACKYHSASAESAETVFALAAATNNTVPSKTCYTSTLATTLYDILAKATVETRRGCEVLCDVETTCAGFSYKDAGTASECVLLAARDDAQKCIAPTTIFLKQTEGCVARTNLISEFGVDPCVDSMFPITQSLGKGPICPWDNRIIIVRAVDANGRRVTFDNPSDNWLEKHGDMWAFAFQSTRVPIVAAACAIAGGSKCPCQPIKKLTTSVPVNGLKFMYPPAPSGDYSWNFPAAIQYLSSPANFETKPDQLNPCGVNTIMFWNNAKQEDLFWWFPVNHTPGTYVTCKAGMWTLWHTQNYHTSGITALACYRG